MFTCKTCKSPSIQTFANSLITSVVQPYSKMKYVFFCVSNHCVSNNWYTKMKYVFLCVSNIWYTFFMHQIFDTQFLRVKYLTLNFCASNIWYTIFVYQIFDTLLFVYQMFDTQFLCIKYLTHNGVWYLPCFMVCVI